ncbi:hypothetical protein DL771_004094 [Monosporascus sp. 5C6A]|nr:hypothetical protein DL771_004094 [Monosporascus sp. 5C6A]
MASAAKCMAPTPFPYDVGRMMSLKSADGKDISLTITKAYSTSLPVMEVRIRTEKGFQKAILKLFDRRFWSGERPKGYPLKYPECFIYSDPISHAHEIKVYRELQALQGRCIPRFLASVTLDMPSYPPDFPPTYFEVRGILLKKVCGFKLEDLLIKLPKNPLAWEEIIQKAVDVAKEINRAGVVHRRFLPWNVVVARLDEHTFQPFILDFSSAVLESECEDTDEPNNPNSFQTILHTNHDPESVGLLMVREVEDGAGYRLRVNYN